MFLLYHAYVYLEFLILACTIYILAPGIMNIQIENSIKDTPKVRNGIYLTTKSRKEGHGIGLQNVKLVVEKYHGQMEICHTEKSFQVKILLYMKLDEK